MKYNESLCTQRRLYSSHLPSSSTSAGAVPAFLASSNSFFLRQSSLDNFWAATADDMTACELVLCQKMFVNFELTRRTKMAEFLLLEGKPSNATKERLAHVIEQNITESGKLARSLCQRSGSREVGVSNTAMTHVCIRVF